MKDAYTNLVLPHQLGKYRLTGRDAAFATELASGTIRRQGTYDAILAACTDRPLANTAAKVLDVLRLGCHQLLGMRVAPHAAISTSVDLVRSEVGPGPVRLRQRRAAQGLGPRPRGLARPGSTPTARPGSPTRSGSSTRSPRRSPRRWVRTEIDALLDGGQRAARRSPWSPGPGRVDARRAARRADAVLAVRRRSRPAATRARCRPSPTDAPACRTRDPSSSPSPSRRLRSTGRDARWLDLCAGPGGKAALLAALAAGRGARVVANEVQPHRADLVRRALGLDSARPTTGSDGRRGGHRSPTATAAPVGARVLRPGPGRRSVHRAWVPCGAGPRRAGGGSRRTSTRWCRSSGPCWRAPSTWSAPAASSSTRPAHRCWPRPATSSGRCWSSATT